MKDTDTRLLSPGLRALADPTRLKILLMLEGKPRTVTEIVDFFELSQPTISRHLQTLAAADLVIREQHGREATYRINPERIGHLFVSLAACFPCCCVPLGPSPQTGTGETATCEIIVRDRTPAKKSQPRTKEDLRAKIKTQTGTRDLTDTSTQLGDKPQTRTKKRKGDTR